MKIQGLAVIAIVIILPMAIILNSYSTNQIRTLDLQISYDSKLQSATYDAIKAFQLNMSNSTTSDFANSKMRDIKASINTFYNSLGSHFDMAGYGEDVLQSYVPAIVYTLYDGYYIYSAYNNTLDDNDLDDFYPNASYKDGETIYGLKPYIYYSCRYKKGSDDFVITYSLDSYITIQGIINGNSVNESGYLLTGVDRRENGDGTYTYTYKGVDIVPENDKEGLEQYVYLEENNTGIGSKLITFYDGTNSYLAGSIVKYPYKKIKGSKYYKENINGEEKVFTMLNDQKYYQNNWDSNSITKNDNGIKYYEEAYNFKNRILNELGLGNLKISDAVDSNGTKYTTMGDDNPYPINREIFAELENSTSSGPYLEDENSDFNIHKTEVIKNSIETNLAVAISNYNKVSGVSVNFAMPKLQEYEWENLTKNISMITFLQGLNIGGKVYNGYSIIQNNINEDFISANSIYILDSANHQYHRVTQQELLNGEINLENCIGILNTDFERRTSQAYYKDDVSNLEFKKNVYYYPREDSASYQSIINLNDGGPENIEEYLKGAGTSGNTSEKYKLAQIYYTALGRERYGMFRVAK